MMNLLLMLISLMMVFSTNNEIEAEFSNTYLLAGDESKDWSLIGSTVDEYGKLEDCKAGGAMYSDNTYTFKPDGTILFDHGTIITIDDTENGNGCSDIKNYVGQWFFFDNETRMSWEILHEQGKPNEPLDITPDTLEIVSLTVNELILMTGDETFTFNSK